MVLSPFAVTSESGCTSETLNVGSAFATIERKAFVAAVISPETRAAIITEATLSFLGLGMPITSPSLGLLIANGYAHLLSGKYWMSFFPGLALLITIVAINLVGDHLRDVLNPRLKT